MSKVKFYIGYSIPMIITYFFRWFYLYTMKNKGFTFTNDIVDEIYVVSVLLFSFYIVMTYFCYLRGRAVDRKSLIIYPLLAGIFDIFFIPVIPTILNTIVLTIAAVDKEKLKEN